MSAAPLHRSRAAATDELRSSACARALASAQRSGSQRLVGQGARCSSRADDGRAGEDCCFTLGMRERHESEPQLPRPFQISVLPELALRT
jgi:hypothetical protein